MKHIFCACCGQKLTLHPAGDDGLVPYCEACKKFWFDSFSTCIIVLITNENGEVLLLRQNYLSKQHATIVSGYMKTCENAEQAARREVMEEVGICLPRMRYVGSCWFDSSELLMLGYIGYAKTKEIRLSEEVDEAVWVAAEDAAQYVVPKTRNSPVHMLLEAYLAEKSGTDQSMKDETA